jgi:predicted nuclease of predicted toxin-antitoxin system
MLRIASDENFNGNVVAGLLQRSDLIDIIRVQDVGLSGSSDEVVLEWCAANSRVLLTHDLRTVPPLAHERVERGLQMPGVLHLPQQSFSGPSIDTLLVYILASEPEELDGQVWFVQP